MESKERLKQKILHFTNERENALGDRWLTIGAVDELVESITKDFIPKERLKPIKRLWDEYKNTVAAQCNGRMFGKTTIGKLLQAIKQVLGEE